MKVFKTRYGWSTKIYNKYNDVESTMYMDVQFKKGEEPTGNKATIDIKKFFMSCYSLKDGTVKPKIIITEYEEKAE